MGGLLFSWNWAPPKYIPLPSLWLTSLSKTLLLFLTPLTTILLWDEALPAISVGKKCHSHQRFLASKCEWGLPKGNIMPSIQQVPRPPAVIAEVSEQGIQYVNYQETGFGVFPGGSLLKNQPNNAWVQFLIREDPMCWGTTKPVSHNYWAFTLQLLGPDCPRARAPKQEKPPQWEACAQQLENGPLLPSTREKPVRQQRPSTA